MGGRWRAALSRARASIGEDFISGLVVDTGFWAPIQTLNFALVPVRRQLLFVNCACVGTRRCSRGSRRTQVS